MRDFLINRLKDIETAIQTCVSQHQAAQGARHEVLNLLQEIGKNVAAGVIADAANEAIEKIAEEQTQVEQ
jgi:hypothetical protein